MRYTKAINLILFVLLSVSSAWAGEFAIPSSRYVSLAGECGLDAAGGIPSSGWSNCTTTDCNTLWGTAPGSITATMINAALTSAAGSNTVVRLPAGNISVSGDINLVSQAVLRGQGASSTIIDLNGNLVSFRVELPCDYTCLASCSQIISIDSEPDSKGDTTISLVHTDSDFASVAVGDVCLIYQNNPSYVYARVTATWTNWECSGGDTAHNIGQWVKVISKNATNGDIEIDPPLLMDLESGLDPEAMCIAQSDWLYRAGLEDLKLIDGGYGQSMIYFRGANESWVKGVETYNAGGGNAGAHISATTTGNFRIEIRDSYFHVGEEPPYDSGENYGMLLSGYNSFWKIENNIFHDLRHTIVYEGPSAGMAALYNYDRSVRTEDDSYMGQFMLNNHAYHPLNNLWEGNISGVYGSDTQFGSSSNATYFRNYARGNKPDYSYTWGRWGFDLWQYQQYFNIVGNVLGAAGEFTYYENATSDNVCRDRTVYNLGQYTSDCDGYNSNTKTTLLRHMNYDTVTAGTRTCNQEDEGCQGATSTDVTLPASLYYTSKPSFLASGDNWPLFDVTKAPNMLNVVSGTAYYNPAYRRYEVLGDPPPSTTPPSASGCTIKSTSGHKIRTGGGGVQLRLQ